MQEPYLDSLIRTMIGKYPKSSWQKLKLNNWQHILAVEEKEENDFIDKINTLKYTKYYLIKF